MSDNYWIPKETEQSTTDRLVWSTKKIQDLEVALDQGYKPGVKMPFYEGKQFLKRGNIVFEYTDAEIQELARCAADIVYFAEKYAVVLTDEGIQQVKLRDYQKDMLRAFQENRFNICLAARQMGKTVMASIFNAWFLTFSTDKNTLLLANKSDTTKEIIDKAKVVIENLPFFMKPGITKYDVMNVKCDNGSRLVGQSTTAKAGIGFTIHLLFLDEFAHIHPTIVDTFYENVYPTLSASKVSRIIITSTPNGFNKFYKIYSAAERGDNEYHPMRIDWWQHPDRDDNWYKRELANLGSIEAFNRQYGNEFVSSSNLLLDPGSMKKMRSKMKDYVHHDFDEFTDNQIETKDFLTWHPGFDIETLKDRDKHWLLTVDIAEGNGGDYSIINIFRVDPMSKKEIEVIPTPGAMYDFFKLTQVGTFRSNEHIIEDFAKCLYLISCGLLYNENTKMIIEYNTYGAVLLNYLATVFPRTNDFDEEMVLRFKHRHDSKGLKYGLKVKNDNKPIFCQNFKSLYENDRIGVSNTETVTEISLFGTLPNGRYGAQMGHDDLAMSSIIATEYFNTTAYADSVEELLDIIDPDMHEFMEYTLYKDNADQGDLNFDIYDLL
jgi:hypothetical protein